MVSKKVTKAQKRVKAGGVTANKAVVRATVKHDGVGQSRKKVSGHVRSAKKVAVRKESSARVGKTAGVKVARGKGRLSAGGKKSPLKSNKLSENRSDKKSKSELVLESLAKLISDQLLCRDLIELDEFDRADVLLSKVRKGLDRAPRGDVVAQLLIRQAALEALFAEYAGIPREEVCRLDPTDIKQELWTDLTKAIFFEAVSRIRLRRVLFLSLQANDRENVRLDASRAMECYRRLKMFRQAGEVCQRMASYFLTKDDAESDIGLALLRDAQRLANLGDCKELYHETSLKLLIHEGVVTGAETQELISQFEAICKANKLKDRFPRVYISGLVAMGFNVSGSSPDIVEGFYRRALEQSQKIKDHGNIFQSAFYLGILLADRLRSLRGMEYFAKGKIKSGGKGIKDKGGAENKWQPEDQALSFGVAVKQAEQALQTALAAARKIKYHLGEISVECNLIRLHAISGNLKAVETICDDLIERKLPANLVGACGLQLASLMIASGLHEKGLKYIKELATEFKRLGLYVKESEALFIAGNVESLQLDWKAAIRSWRRSIRLDKRSGVATHGFEKYQGIAHALLIAAGEVASGSADRDIYIQAASESLNRAVVICARGQDGSDILNLAKVLQTQAHAAVLLNKSSEALRFLASARPILEQLGLRMDLGVVDALSGLVLLELAKRGRINLFSEALSAFQRAEGFIASAGGGAMIWKLHLYIAWTYFFWGIASTDVGQRYQMWEMSELSLIRAEESRNEPSSFKGPSEDMTNALVLRLFQRDDEAIYDFGFRLNSEFIKDQRRAEEWKGRNPRLRPAEMMH